MDAQTAPQTSTIGRQTLVRYRWAIALGFLIAVAVLVAYRFTTVPVQPSLAADRAQASLVGLAQQQMLGYLHALVQPLPTPVVRLDPAQQSVMGYLRAHDRVDRPPAFWNKAAQALLDYIRAHSR